MKVKQQTLQSFEFILSEEDDEKFFSYLDKNEPLLKGNVLMFSGKTISENIKEVLKEKSICFFHKNCELIMKKKGVIKLPNISVEDALETIKRGEEEVKVKEKKRGENIREVIEKPIRSGTFIKTKNDLIILSQINSGSEIEVAGNIELFGTVNGRIVCGGTYMLIRDIGENGYIIFNGIILEKDRFKSRKAKLLKLDKSNKLIVEEL